MDRNKLTPLLLDFLNTNFHSNIFCEVQNSLFLHKVMVAFLKNSVIKKEKDHMKELLQWKRYGSVYIVHFFSGNVLNK